MNERTVKRVYIRRKGYPKARIDSIHHQGYRGEYINLHLLEDVYNFHHEKVIPKGTTIKYSVHSYDGASRYYTHESYICSVVLCQRTAKYNGRSLKEQQKHCIECGYQGGWECLVDSRLDPENEIIGYSVDEVNLSVLQRLASIRFSNYYLLKEKKYYE
jgi:hypothetical protein